ncbi:hypothetical protein WICPIJ_000392 [Wickerhamomyces pijperi]|uniref:Uncharacterized protein n=1 Tax=Wickerhamomyces pijperi TaxID=599730 RepID=A0A9P8QDR1_WICPI|nr:hypothetical protein WICPIJ_000392 [Wickerhamomyces pijperi]
MTWQCFVPSSSSSPSSLSSSSSSTASLLSSSFGDFSFLIFALPFGVGVVSFLILDSFLAFLEEELVAGDPLRLFDLLDSGSSSESSLSSKIGGFFTLDSGLSSSSSDSFLILSSGLTFVSIGISGWLVVAQMIRVLMLIINLLFFDSFSMVISTDSDFHWA